MLRSMPDVKAEVEGIQRVDALSCIGNQNYRGGGSAALQSAKKRALTSLPGAAYKPSSAERVSALRHGGIRDFAFREFDPECSLTL